MILQDSIFYTDSTDPTALSGSTVKHGDIWIKSDIGYYYIPKEISSKHVYAYDSGNNITASDGGLWLRAQWWWMRSPNVADSTGFWRVGGSGGVSSSNYARNANGVVPCFSI